MAVTTITANDVFYFKSTAQSPTSVASPRFMLIGNRTDSSHSSLYIDSNPSAALKIGSDTGTLNSQFITRGARGIAGPSQSAFCRFVEHVSFFGSSLTGADVTNLRNRITSFNSAIGRT